jgi:YVTN family beta-propeller protein
VGFLAIAWIVSAQEAKPVTEIKDAKDASQILPTGMAITPTAAKGSVFQQLNPDLPDLPQFTVDHPVSTAVSPDGNTLLVLTTGYNRNNNRQDKAIAGLSNEYVFVYDISRGQPTKQQVLQIPNTFVGLVWKPDGREFYVSGGPDDVVHIFEQAGGHWQEAGKGIPLVHGNGLGIESEPLVAGLAVNPDGNRLLVANYQNDSVSVIDLQKRTKAAELDLRPGKNDPAKKGVAGGEYPYWPVFCGNDKAYVSSLRDREIVVLDMKRQPRVLKRIKVQGQPNRLLLNREQTLLFAALDNSDSVGVLDTRADRLLATVRATAPENIFPNRKGFKGSNPNSLALSPDERHLYVTNGGTNSVAVIALAQPLTRSKVEGLIPTGWYPNSVSVARDGSTLYIVNGKSDAGPNPRGCRNSFTTATGQECYTAGQYILQLQKGGLLSLPVPVNNELDSLTDQVRRNNHFLSQGDEAPLDPLFARLHAQIRHVIYIVKENRTYDQVLGDLEKGNGDPSLTLFKEPLTPNHHQLARSFVTLDNFYDSGDVSGDGWNWSSAARITDIVEKTIAPNYAGRKLPYDVEGKNREMNVSVASRQQRARLSPEQARLKDADDQLPGVADVAAPDSAEGQPGAGYLWDAARRAKLTVRNYGFFLDLSRYSNPHPLPLLHNPAALARRVAFPVTPGLHGITDVYFRGFDQRFADYWRFKEWEREFDGYVKKDNLPALELVRFPHDHFGTFKDAADGVNTVETQMADNDYAVGLLVQKIAESRYSKDTLIFVVEDDAQNGPDHVDAHRSLCLVAGSYVKQGAVISERFNTVSLLRTIEAVLGIPPLGLNDAVQPPMTQIFTDTYAPWTYKARTPNVLRATKLPLPAAASASPATQSNGTLPSGVPPGGTMPSETMPSETMPSETMHDAAYWESHTQGLDFSVEDRIDSDRFNLVLWQGLMGENVSYPTSRSGTDLRQNRGQLLEEYKQTHTH